VAALRTTGPFKRIPRGREPRVTTGRGTQHADQRAPLAARHPLAAPGCHGLRRRPGAGPRRQRQVVGPPHRRPGCPGTPL